MNNNISKRKLFFAFVSGCVWGGGGQGLALIFIPAGGGASPLDPLPPSPLSSSAPENLGFGNFFKSWGKNFRCLWCMPYTVYILLHVCSIYIVFQTTMPQRSLLVYFSSPVPPLPRAKCEDVIDALLCFRFKDRIPGQKRQKAEVPSDPESVDDEARPDNLSDVSHSGSDSDSSSSSGSSSSSSSSSTTDGGYVQVSLILTDKKDHCHLA